MAEKIQVVLCEVGKEPYVKEMPNELKWMQEFVGGYIETAPLTRDGLILICNDEGMRLDLPINRNLGVEILGNFFVCRTDGSEFASITEADKELLNLK